MTSKSQLRVGVGRSDITPPIGTYLSGYGREGRFAESINDPLHSTVLVFDQNGEKAALISLDWIMVDEVDCDRIRAEIATKTGIAHVTVCATHTHCGPNTMQMWGWGEKDVDYIAQALPKIVESVVLADASLQSARVGIGTAQSDVGINRREIMSNQQSVGLGFNPWGPYDPEMTVLRFVGDSGAIATLVHYGAHPTALGIVRFISRDWPGVMIDRLETITGAPVLYINGAEGDVAPRTNIHAPVGDGLSAALEVGYRAAAHAMWAYNRVKEFRDLDLAVHEEEIVLPLGALPALEEARKALTAAEEKKEQWGEGVANFNYWRAVVEAHAEPPKRSRAFFQRLIALGPVVFVPFAGEPFSEIILRLRHHSPFQHTLCAGTTNGVHGYYVTREARARGGYEVWVARAYGAYLFADEIDDVLVKENLKLLQTLANRDRRNVTPDSI